ncbi:hypothetical protein AK830_g3037 [Neonectria ditissima]|uniref:BZIP domain-containing protein n=1 Tax=Neonectria ditissima TaxID=78410 RepID=A0A0N8H842_9HYPO|nr:hypothetical protein AK830_g3037 [Neonectria ditissima]
MEEGYIVDPPDGVKTAASRPTARKVIRRDPDKRRLQNRLAQKNYREKQKKRIQELERRAEASGTVVDSVDSSSRGQQVVSRSSPDSTGISTEAYHDAQTINPSHLQPGTISSATVPEEGRETWDNDLFSPSFDQWLTGAYSADPSDPPVIFFNCGCPSLHIPAHPTSVLLPVIPDPHMNTLRIEIMCSLAALLENCLQVGITQRMFCSDDAVSPFYRPQIDAPAERATLVASVQSGFRALKFDLRPTRNQIITNHHPFLDVIPFNEVRDNLISCADEIDEDEFFHDSLNHLTCWGSVKGAHTGSPWDSRSWEASEEFLQKWWLIVGGEDGELTRQSRWWRSLRGERVTELL